VDRRIWLPRRSAARTRIRSPPELRAELRAEHREPRLVRRALFLRGAEDAGHATILQMFPISGAPRHRNLSAVARDQPMGNIFLAGNTDNASLRTPTRSIPTSNGGYGRHTA
jgi:hypothetical protein